MEKDIRFRETKRIEWKEESREERIENSGSEWKLNRRNKRITIHGRLRPGISSQRLRIVDCSWQDSLLMETRKDLSLPVPDIIIEHLFNNVKGYDLNIGHEFGQGKRALPDIPINDQARESRVLFIRQPMISVWRMSSGVHADAESKRVPGRDMYADNPYTPGREQQASNWTYLE